MQKILAWSIISLIYFIIFYLSYNIYLRYWDKNYYRYIEFDNLNWKTGELGIIGKIFIPLTIVNNKNCDELYKWQDEKVPRDFQGLCPWAKKRDKRKVRIGDSWFDFPREYLRSIYNIPADIDANMQDGMVANISGTLSYPDMQPSINNQQKEIDFLIIDFKRSYFANTTPLQFFYKNLLNLYKDPKCEISLLNYDEKLKLNKYEVIIENSNNDNPILYTNDNPEKPEYFIACYSDNAPRCKSALVYKDFVGVDYIMPREFLPLHEDIKKQILNFMQRYEIPTPY